MKKPQRILLFVLTCFLFAACGKELMQNDDASSAPVGKENAATFTEAGSIDLGEAGASEISAYDPLTKRLFVVNNQSQSTVDVLDMSKFPAVSKLQSIDFSAVSGVANSVSVSNGLLAIALEGINKQENGKIAILNTATLKQVKLLTVGALPDMVTFSPDGRYIVSANEGEPNSDYTIDPPGSVSIIDVKNDCIVRTLDFSAFESQKKSLLDGCFRVFGPNATLAQDVEPEYVAVSADSKTAWVTLQENNGLAEVDLVAGAIKTIIPLGTKDFNLSANAIDASDEDGKTEQKTWPVKSYYLPDAAAYFMANGNGYLALANEGDAREYDTFEEEVRVKDLVLDPKKFPNAAFLQQDENLGRLNVTKTSGDTDGDGDYDALFGFGGRSLSILDAATGKLVADIGKDLEARVIAAGLYDDDRSDSKGVEIEGVTTASISGKTVAFIGMERADAIAVYDISNPQKPQFLQVFATGDAPEGLLYIKPEDSPNGRSLLVISCEDDGTVRFYQPN